MATTTASQPVAITSARSPYRFSVDQYHRLSEAGILKTSDRVELLEGLLVNKMTIHPPHATAVGLLQAELSTRLPQGWILRTQSPITTTDSEPEPDVVVVPGPVRRYARAHPGPADIALVIEVSDTTLEADRNDQKRIYARARIPIYWIVNIPESQIEVYTQPRGGRNPTYRQRRDYLLAEMVPLVISGQEIGTIPVRDVLP